MPKVAPVVDRGALYYPFIHVRNEAWLKATLLCFPHLERMVPEGYATNDTPIAGFFANETGRLGRPMLHRRDLNDPATMAAHATLLDKIRADASTLRKRFSQAAARAEYRSGGSAFQLHEHKLGHDLIAFLRDQELAWAPDRAVRSGNTWWAVHPFLGEAIMSTNAVALAEAHNLEIVTDTGLIHDAVVGAAADDVYDRMIRGVPGKVARKKRERTNDLFRFVIMTEFDVDRLSLEEIVELNRNRGDLAALKSELLRHVEDLGRMPDRGDWDAALAAKSKEVIEEWASRESFATTLKSLGGRIFKNNVGELIGQLAPGLLAGTAAMAVAGTVPGLAVAAVFTSAVATVSEARERRRPYRYLTTLKKRGARVKYLLDADG